MLATLSSENRVAKNQSSTTAQQTSVDASKSYLESRILNQQQLADTAGSVVRTITPAAISQLHLKSGEYVESSPSVGQTVAPIMPSSPSKPENLIDEDRPLIESKDGALARNLESTMMLVIFYRRPHRLPQSDRNLGQTGRIY